MRALPGNLQQLSRVELVGLVKQELKNNTGHKTLRTLG